MSLIHTESFVAFGKSLVNDDFTPENTAIRNAYTANLKRAGYDVITGLNTTAANSGGFIVRDDPVAPSRSALVHSAGSIAAGVNGVTAAIRKQMPITIAPIIVGFSLYIPAEFVPNTIASTVACLRVTATTKASATWQNSVLTPIFSATEAFRISQDLLVRWGTDAAQSTTALKAGALNYLELQISATDVRVWLNDTFIMQKVVSLVPETVGFVFENNTNANGTQMTGLAGRWAISNVYALAADAIAPNVRLGPTTRVIGSRPDTDVDVRFNRPEGAISNASVVAQDLVDAPPEALQSNVIGDFDIYSSAQGAAAADSALVHAVAVKVLATNLEPDAHTIRPIVKAGATERADARGKTFKLETVTGLPIDVFGMALRPSDGRIYAVGTQNGVYMSGANADISQWTQLQNDGSATVCRGIVFDAAGNGLVARSDNRVLNIAAGSTVVTLSANPVGAANGGDVAIAPDGSFLIATSTTAVNAVGRATTVGGVWTTTSAAAFPAPLFLGISRIVSNGARLLCTAIGALANVATSDNNGLNWTQRVHGAVASSFLAATWDGLAYIIAATNADATLNGAPFMRRSTDGLAWGPITAIGSSVSGATGALNDAVSNTATHESIFFGDAGCVVMSQGGLDWRQMPKVTTRSLRAGVLLPSGDYVIAGDAGTIISVKPQSVDQTLPSLAGYTMTANSSIIDPATGNAWTPAAAAIADFGVRLTS